MNNILLLILFMMLILFLVFMYFAKKYHLKFEDIIEEDYDVSNLGCYKKSQYTCLTCKHYNCKYHKIMVEYEKNQKGKF